VLVGSYNINLAPIEAGNLVEGIRSACSKVREITGYAIKHLVISQELFRVMQQDEDIQDRMRYAYMPREVRLVSILANMLGNMFDLDTITIQEKVFSR
jgi:hypothetical protein